MDIDPNTLFTLLPIAHDDQIMSDHSTQQASLISLRNSFLKKFTNDCTSRQQKSTALAKFLACNENCKTWEPEPLNYYYDLLLRVRSKLWGQLHSGELQASIVSLTRATERLLPGPGSTRGTKHTDFVRKLFHSDLTCTDLGLYRHYADNIPGSWKRAESIRSSSHKVIVVKGSKLNFADKSSSEARIINTEANINMMYQKGIGTIIEGLLERFYKIDLSKQPDINRAMARLGSLDQSFCTIDLSSASDSISTNLVRFLLPTDVFQTLSAVRSKMIELPQEFGGHEVELAMFSTMGNGFTFPLQTLIFAALVEEAYEDLNIEYRHSRRYSVFGDDIIVEPKAYHKVTSLLEYCGFKVNTTKSFSSGPFRESCGRDFFKGHDVRGIYLKRYRCDAHVYSLFNRLTRFSIHSGVDLTRILARIARDAKRKLYVPFDLADAAGFKVPGWIAEERGNKPRKYTYLEAPGRRQQLFADNSEAILVGALGGYVLGASRESGVSVTVRRRKTDLTFAVRRGTTSSWDFVPHRGLMSRDYDFIYAII